MPQYIIDQNLPYYFDLWKTENFIYVRDIDKSLPDRDIWKFAKENNLTIITKDYDFSTRMIISNPPPKVIHPKIGNMKLLNFHSFISENWNSITEMNNKYKLVNVYFDRIEGI